MSDDSQKCYDMFFTDAMHLLNDHQLPVELIAGTLMAIAQRLYKTHLNSEDYEHMMNEIRNAHVEPYDVEKVRLH